MNTGATLRSARLQMRQLLTPFFTPKLTSTFVTLMRSVKLDGAGPLPPPPTFELPAVFWGALPPV